MNIYILRLPIFDYKGEEKQNPEVKRHPNNLVWPINDQLASHVNFRYNLISIY